MGALKINGVPVLKYRSAEFSGDGSDPALKVYQLGSGRVFDFQDGGISVVYMDDGGRLKLGRILQFLSNEAVEWPSAPDNTNNTLLQFAAPSEDTIKLTFDTRTGIKKIVLRNVTDAFSVFDTDWDSGGVFTLYQALDARQALKNTGAANGGAVAVDDSMRVAGNVEAYSGGLGGSVDAGLLLGGFLKLVERPNDPSTNPPDGYAYAYIYSSGGTRQFRVKYNDNDTIYTGSLDLT